MTGTEYNAFARDVLNAGDTIQYVDQATGESVTFQPLALNWVNQDNSRQQLAQPQAVVATATDDVLYWPNGYGTGRHFQFQTLSRKLEKLLILDNAATLPTPTVTGTIWLELEFIIKNSSGVELYLDGIRWARTNNVRVQTANRIEFRDSATGTNVLWYLDYPRAYDSSPEPQQTIGQFEVRRSGPNHYITVRIPRTWVQSATFPIYIDPSPFSSQPDAAAGKDTYVSNFNATQRGNNYGVTTSIMSLGSHKGLIEFDCSSIPSDATIEAGDAATLYLYHTTAGAALAWTITVYSIASGNADWTEGTKNNGTGVAGDCCWNYKEQTSGSETAWAGSAGLGTNGTDYEATALGSANGDRADVDGTEYSAVLTASRVEGWFGASNTNYGLLLLNNEDTQAIGSSDHGTAARRPKLVITYTEAGGGVTGDAAITLAALTSSAAGTVAVAGSASVTLAALTCAATGTVAVDGAASPTLAALTATATGTVAIAGDAALSLAALTLTATGVVTSGVTGDAGIALSALALSAAGGVAIAGDASIALAALASSATGEVAIDGSAAVTLAAVSLSAAGTVAEGPVGQADITLAAAALTAAGTVAIAGTASITLGAISPSATGTVAVAGQAAITLASIALSAAGNTEVGATGNAAISLDSMTLTATGLLWLIVATRSARSHSLSVSAQGHGPTVTAIVNS
jgi:hypothetical protein